MFRPPTKYSEYLQDVRKSIDYILKRVNATTVTQIVAGTNVTISPASGTGVVTINASGGGGGGLPAGGTTGQILAKINNVDYNAEWIDNYALWTSTVKHEVKAGEAINKGQAVYVSSADGTNMIVSKASNALEATSSKTLGILAQSLAHNAKGFVITEGLLAGLDTSAAGAAGDPVWLGTDGNLLFGLANKPYAPANMVSIGVVTRKNSSNGEIFIRIQNGFELDELHNVDARNPNNNDGIFYNSTTQLWEHKPVSAVYATPTLAQVTTAGNTTTNAITIGNATVNGPVNSVFAHTPTTNYTGFGGVQLNVADGTERGFFKLNPQTGEVKIGSTGSGYFTTLHSAGLERMRIFFSSGNVAINTTTDAGYKLDVNGTARIVNKTNIGSETVSQGSLYIGHNGTAGGSNGTSTVFFVSQFGNYPYRLGAENNGYDFFLRQVNGGQGSINIDFSGLNSISYNITNTNVLNQSFGKSAIIDAKTSLNSYLAIGTRFGFSDSLTAGDSPLIFFRSMSGSYYDKTLDAAVTIRNGLPTVADNNITKNTAYWYRNGYIGIGTSTTLSATNTLKGAITINQGTTIGYQNLTPGSLSSVITSGTSTTVSFTPNNGNNAPGYDIVVGTIITANGVSRRVTAVNYQTVTVDSAVDWSAGYNYTYRNPYVSIADGSTPIFDILPSGNVAVGTTTAIAKFTVSGSITAASSLAQGVFFNNTLVAAANNDVLVGLDINPTFTNGAFTGVQNIPLRVNSQDNAVAARFVSTSGSLYIVPRLSSLYGTYIGTHNSTQTAQIPLSLSANRFIFDNGNVLIGTTTDAGYKLDVSGTVRFTHGLTIDYFGATIGGVTLALSSQAGGTISSGASAGNNNGPYITLSGPAYLNPTAGNSGMFSITGLYYASSGTAIFNHLNLAPTINNSGTYSGIVRGIYYNPTLTSLTGTTHRAIETTSGDVLLATTSGNVAIGTSTLGTATELTLGGNQTASSAIARGQLLNTTLVAAANNDVLVGLDINPTFTNGAFTGVQNYAVRLINSAGVNVLFRTGVNNSGTHKISFSNLGATTNSFISAASSGTFSNVNLVLGQAFFDGSTVNTTNNIVIQSNSSTVFEPRTAISYAYLTGDAYVVTAVNNTNAVLGFSNGSNATSTRGAAIFAIAGGSFASTARLDFAISNVNAPVVTTADVAMSLFNSKNFAIGTTTDAGYKLQVQGSGYFNTNTASTNSILKLTDNVNGTAWVGFSSTTTTGFFIGSNGGMTLGRVTADNSNPSSSHAQVIINQSGNANLQLTTNTANTGIVFSDGVNATIRMNFPSAGEAAITTISAHNLSIGVASSVGSLSSTTMKFFQSTGNVTIGTTTDAGYKLDVAGTVRAQVSLSGIPNIIHVSNLQTDGGPGGAIAFYTGGIVGNASRITAQRSGPVGQSDIALETNGVTRLFVSVLGNVGLGTTNPTDKFHIVDNTNGNKFARISAGGTDASAAWVAQNDQVDNIVYRVFGSAATGSQMGQALARSASLIANLGGTGKFLIGSYSGTDLIFGTSDQARMRLVDTTGNFLIGTMTDAGYRLNVSGSIRSTLDVVAEGNLKSNYQAGNEGGEINLNTPATGTTINTGVTIDVYQNKLRIFESGGLNRGGYFDISALANGVGTNFSPVGYTGILNIPGNPPGQQNVDIQNGIVINIF